MISLQASDIFFCIRYDYLQDQNSAGSLFKGLMFCAQYAFPPAFLRFVQNVWKANAGFFFLVFCTSPPPYNFSIGPSLKWMLSVYVGSTQTKASYQSLQTTISPSFSLRDSRANETRVRVKIIQREKGETRRGERQIRDYRQSPISHVFLSPQHLTFLAWGDFHAQSRFAPSTIPEGNKGCS